MTFAGEDLYPTIAEKAAALGFALAQNHPFVNGNKRTAHAAMEVFLVLNGYEIEAPVDEQERIFLSLAAGEIERDKFADWIKALAHCARVTAQIRFRPGGHRFKNCGHGVASGCCIRVILSQITGSGSGAGFVRDRISIFSPQIHWPGLV